MPNWNDLKTTNPARFPLVGGKKSWDLSDPANSYDEFIDRAAGTAQAVGPFTDDPTATAEVTPTTSPMTVTALTETTVIVSTGPGGSLASVTKNGINLSLQSPVNVPLATGEQCVITYTGAIRIVQDVGFLNNSKGVTEVIPLTDSPHTLTNDKGRTLIVNISGGAPLYVKRHGIILTEQFPLTGFPLPRSGTMEIAFNELDPPLLVISS